MIGLCPVIHIERPPLTAMQTIRPKATLTSPSLKHSYLDYDDGWLCYAWWQVSSHRLVKEKRRLTQDLVWNYERGMTSGPP